MPAHAINSEAEWLALREQHIGGSEVAALFYRWRLADGCERVLHLFERAPEGAEPIECLSPYTTGYRLWQEKAGKLAPDFQSNERVMAGQFLEPALAAWSQQRWPDWSLRKTRRYLSHPDVTGWGATLDYELVALTYPPVEFKNVDALVFRDQWAGDGEDLVPPLHITLQLQAQIGLTKAADGWVVACIGGNQLRRVRIERHEPTQARLAEAITMFWQAVAAGAEPVWMADYDTVADLYRDGRPGADAVDLNGDADAAAELATYVEANAAVKAANARLATAKAALALRLGTATRAFGHGYSLTWPVVERQEKIIPALIQTAMTWRGGLTVRKAAPK